MTGTAATPAPATGAVAEPGNQPVPLSVAPIHKKKSWKSAELVRDEKSSPKREQEEEAYCPASKQADCSEAGPSRAQEEEEEELPTSPRGRTWW